MPLPPPPVPLKDHCSIIYDNKLYAYQSDAFQSLDLKQGGTWTQLPTGASVNGSICLQGTVAGKNSFVVAGGATSDQTYKGVQHYDFEANKWQDDTLAVGVAINRQRHGVAFLQQSSQMLMYAGSQDDDSTPSSQTFLISTNSPYNVQAFNSKAPPVTSPLMLPYNATHALMLGGDPQNKNLWTFGPQDGWQQLEVSLQNGLQDSSKVQAAMLDGSDGSKVLEIFDMSASPNQISTVLLQNATGTSKPNKKARSYLSSQHHPVKRRKRDTTLADRPAYNSTLAPQDVRAGFSLASDPTTGLVVATGGNTQQPLAMFNQTGNQWIDPNTFFGTDPTPGAGTASATSSTTPSSTSSASSAPSAAAAAQTDNSVRNRSLTIMGGVLGGAFGTALILILVLLLLRRCRKRREKTQQRTSDYAMEDKEEMDFADVGADFMKEAGGSATPSNHRRNRSDRSDASANVRANDRVGAASSQSKRALLHAKGDSAGSGKSFWSRGRNSPDKQPPVISAPIMNPTFPAGPAARTTVAPDPRTEPRTEDTGWSRYFNNNSTDVLSAQRNQRADENRPATYFSNSQSQSDYTESRITSSHAHESAEVEPLNFRASQAPPSNSNAISPISFPRPGLGVALTHGASPMPDAGPPSPSTFVSDIYEEDEYKDFSHDSDGQRSWTPVAAGGERGSGWTDDRPVSSVRSSQAFPHPGEKVRIPNFPMPISSRNSTATSLVQPANDSDKGLRNIASRGFAGTSGARQQAVSDVRTGTQRVVPGQGGPQVRTFPRPKEQLGARGRGGSETEDMSWLNLGTSAEQANHFPGRR